MTQTPTLTVSPSDAIIESATSVTMTCLTASSGSTTYTFLKDNFREVSQASGTYTLSLTPSDSGNWTCTATTDSVVSNASTAHSLTIVGTFVK